MIQWINVCKCHFGNRSVGEVSLYLYVWVIYISIFWTICLYNLPIFRLPLFLLLIFSSPLCIRKISIFQFKLKIFLPVCYVLYVCVCICVCMSMCLFQKFFEMLLNWLTFAFMASKFLVIFRKGFYTQKLKRILFFSF